MNSQELLGRYQAGQIDAATAIFDRYFGRLIALAGSRIGRKLNRRIDAEDVVLSAYRSFFMHAKRGDYELAESGDLWRLLATITLNKLHGQIEQQTAAKRSIHGEEPAERSTESAETQQPSATQIVEVLEELRAGIGSLTSDERFVLNSRLAGQSFTEISIAIGKSERTTRRLMMFAKQKVERRLLGNVAGGAPVRLAATRGEPLLSYSNYVLERLLGMGAMGKVFRARDVTTGKTVAIKALHKSRQSDERAVSQFVQESRIMARLSHPHIVGTEGVGQFPGGGYFIVMEFIDGTDLQRRSRAGPLPLAEALTIIAQIADAVGYAHDNGVVHCDLKPGNILLDQNGRVAVTDFGFAILTLETSATSPYAIGGTKGFIAPEVIRHHGNPTPAADIYALGALLWVLLTGTVPSDPRDLDVESEELMAVAGVVGRCLADDPRDRIQTARELTLRINDL